MRQITLVVVIPVGPACEFDHISDTIESVRHYVTPSHVVIVLDDSGKGTGAAVKERFSETVVLTTPRNYGKEAGLYLNLSKGFAFAYENYFFDILLRLDTDALIIGPNPEQDAMDYFQQNPDVGIIGSYRTDCNGDPRDFSWPRNQLIRELGFRSLSKDPLKRLKGWLFLRTVFNKSKHNGYEAGEHCMGGAYFVSRECIGRLYKNHLLSRQEISWSKLQEDQIFGLFIYSVGMRHGDFATGSLPMGLRWRGLPCPPEILLARNKKITHSTRFFENLSEKAIRVYFREQRNKDIT
jgi:glycosyltransferase involved in cell wall biosynthesis